MSHYEILYFLKKQKNYISTFLFVKREGERADDEDAKRSAEFGKLHNIAYTVVRDTQKREIIVSTTSPETVFGDRAIAVHPDDPRYIVTPSPLSPCHNIQVTKRS